MKTFNHGKMGHAAVAAMTMQHHMKPTQCRVSCIADIEISDDRWKFDFVVAEYHRCGQLLKAISRFQVSASEAYGWAIKVKPIPCPTFGFESKVWLANVEAAYFHELEKIISTVAVRGLTFLAYAINALMQCKPCKRITVEKFGEPNIVLLMGSAGWLSLTAEPGVGWMYFGRSHETAYEVVPLLNEGAIDSAMQNIFARALENWERANTSATLQWERVRASGGKEISFSCEEAK